MKMLDRAVGFFSVCLVTIYGVLIWMFGPALAGFIVAITEWIGRH